MMNNVNVSSLEKGTPLLTVRFSAHGFATQPKHSQQLTNYLITIIKSNLSEPHAWTGQLSQVLNRLLTIVCLVEGVGSDIDLVLSNRGQLITLMFEVTASSHSRTLYPEMARALKKTEAHPVYTDLTTSEKDLIATFNELSENYPTKMQAKINELSGKLKLLFQIHLKTI